MSKPIRLILFSSLILYCCKGYKVSITSTANQTESRSKRDLDNLPKEKEIVISLTADEQKKLNSLKHAFEKVIEKLKNQIQGCQNDNKSKCDNFWTWLNDKPQKQKELVNAFKETYEFIDKKRNEKANDKDFDTYISDAIDCQVNNNDCTKDNKYGNGTNEIEQFFRGVLNDMSSKNTHDEMFEYLKKELLDPDNHVAGLKTNWKN
ncbi:Mlp family lipoprotein [Borrelia hispanica]|uniref:Mlp family lipoprotein n=1 Tax=Borrelia hispanica TaxID=40835 RepID=UPI00046663A2|nr:Mlp family lipoprotein [Borrelia hispanica]